MCLPTYLWTTLLPPIVPTNHALATTYILAIYMHVLPCLEHLHQRSVCDPALEILDEVQKSDPAASLEECCDPETIHSFQSTGGDVPGEPAVSYMLAEPLCPKNLI
jgi:hypothetical protein